VPRSLAQCDKNQTRNLSLGVWFRVRHDVFDRPDGRIERIDPRFQRFPAREFPACLFTDQSFERSPRSTDLLCAASLEHRTTVHAGTCSRASHDNVRQPLPNLGAGAYRGTRANLSRTGRRGLS